MSFLKKDLAVLFKQMISVKNILKKLLNVRFMTAAFQNRRILSDIPQRTDSSILVLSGQDKYLGEFGSFIYSKKASHGCISSTSSCLCPMQY